MSEFLNHVQYQGQTFDLERGKRVIARVSPIPASAGYPIDQLDALLANGPQLSIAERKAMAQDVRAVRKQLSSRRDPWA